MIYAFVLGFLSGVLVVLCAVYFSCKCDNYLSESITDKAEKNSG